LVLKVVVLVSVLVSVLCLLESGLNSRTFDICYTMLYTLHTLFTVCHVLSECIISDAYLLLYILFYLCHVHVLVRYQYWYWCLVTEGVSWS